ncbi:hypothetical protein BGZ54_005264, partial [Gamsiella multidivaricata]
SDLIKIFWQDVVLRKLLQDYAKPDFPITENITQADVSYWLSEKAPGLSSWSPTLEDTHQTFKLNEPNAIKYRRLPEAKLPSRTTSTLGGTDYFLTEIRNVVKTKQADQDFRFGSRTSIRDRSECLVAQS